MRHLPDRSAVTTGPKGEVANEQLVRHTARFEKRLHRVTDHVHTAVGCGLANSTLLIGPEGAVVIDTGEDIEEAQDHLALFRSVSDAPVRAVLYSHFHYASGTRAYIDAAGSGPVPEVWGHERIDQNITHAEAEIGPAWRRRAAIQFGAFLPKSGPDAMPNYGIGPFLFHPDRFRGTPGYVPPTRLVRGDTRTSIAGIRVQLFPAPSDSDDTLIIWLPDERVCINNHVWPALFNIYPLRGGRYRDPLAHVAAIDRIRALEPEHLVGVHGPPISGAKEVAHVLTEYRDAIQYIWDQTVRGINRDLGIRELTSFVTLPQHLAEGRLTRQLYGLVPHHVRQIHNGLFGWFDNDTAGLFPLPPEDEARKIIEGFGGPGSVLAKARAAVSADELGWAAQLGRYLILADPDDSEAKRFVADVLRQIAQRSSGANVRAFCLTQARELEGEIELPRAFLARPNEDTILRAPPSTFVHALRVQLDPERSANITATLAVHFTDSDNWAGLAVRRGVAEPLDDEPARYDYALHLTLPVWARLFLGLVTLRDAIADGAVRIEGGVDAIERFFALFDDVHLVGWE